MPEVKALRTGSEGKVRQPKPPFRSLPANSLHIGPSGSGKSLTLLRTLMDSDKLGGMFDKYLLFSPNIHVDPQYQVLIDYVHKTTGQKKEDFCYEDFDQNEIRKLMDDQKKANAYLRKIGSKRLLSACCLIDDFGERADLMKAHGSVINSLFTRGRHLQISVYGLLLQRFRLANPTIRYNAHVLYVHKLNSQMDLEALAEEFSAVVGGKDNFIEMYRRATAKKYGFLFIVTGAEPRFYSSYDSEFRLTQEGEQK
jgi:hypothetical protein